MGTSISHRNTLDVGHIGVALDQLPPLDDGPVDLAGWFGASEQDRPLELEIGSGKGTFLVQQATVSPHVNFVGVEYAKAYWRYAADRCRRRGLENVRLMHAEAGTFVRYYVPDGCLRLAHIYFPDPWPKKRHHKRRLIQESFLRVVHRKLTANGQVNLATDHCEYFDWMVEHAQRVESLFERRPFESPDSAGEGERVGTNFERKYKQQGRSFHAMILKKTDAPQ
jgi:tRNA (guanine-N7-)-methyltransferase